MHAYNELTNHYLYLVRYVQLRKDVNNGWFVVGAGGLDVGVVDVAADVGSIHEYISFGMRSRAKMCAFTFNGLLSTLWEVRNQQNSMAHYVLNSLAMGQFTARKMLHRSPYVRINPE